MLAHRRVQTVTRLLAGSCVCVALLLVATLAATLPAGGQGADSPVHVQPVTAPISDPFRAPETPYGPGNRGIKYDTDPGTEVRASADGEVTFAGRVAWELHVTVLHPDGVRTSYSFLEEIDVVVGQRVRRGDRIGLAGEMLHFGARLGDAYFDPASLFGAGDVQVELLPLEVPPGSTPEEEAAALRALLLGSGGGFGLPLPSLGDAIGWLTDGGQVLAHYAVELNPIRRTAEIGWGLAQMLVFPPPCTDDPLPLRPAAAGARVAVLVGGLGSSSDLSSIERLQLDKLGYEGRDVVRFSYAGGRTPDTGASIGGLEPRPYVSADTQGDLRVAALHLADLIELVAAERPGEAVDLYGHSMGGVVARLALAELESRGFPLESLGLVATLGSPHQGADLATAIQAANTTLAGKAGLELAEQLLDTGLDPGAVAVAQLSETSALVEELARAGVPDEVELLSVAARGDVVVPVPRTRVTGARNVTVADAGLDAHSHMVASDAVTHELGLALAGMPQRCTSVWDTVNDEVMGHGISYVQDLAGYTLSQLPGRAIRSSGL